MRLNQETASEEVSKAGKSKQETGKGMLHEDAREKGDRESSERYGRQIFPRGRCQSSWTVACAQIADQSRIEVDK